MGTINGGARTDQHICAKEEPLNKYCRANSAFVSVCKTSSHVGWLATQLRCVCAALQIERLCVALVVLARDAL